MNAFLESPLNITEALRITKADILFDSIDYVDVQNVENKRNFRTLQKTYKLFQNILAMLILFMFCKIYKMC